MIHFYHETDARAVWDSAYLSGDCLVWAEGETLQDRCRWVAKYCIWMHCFRGDYYRGFMALQPYGSEYLVHFGVDEAGFSELRKGLKLAIKLSKQHGKRLCAYIEDEGSAAYRIAAAFGFKPSTERHFYEFTEAA